MGTAASIPEKLSCEQCQNIGADLFSIERFREHADPDGMITKDRLLILKDQTDCFMSHDWGIDQQNRDNHIRVSLINEVLKGKGLITWFDSEKMEGNIVDQMCSGIDNSQIVLVFVTKRYMDKVSGKLGSTDNCKLEFSYSVRKKGIDKIIPIVMEDQMRDTKSWIGELGFTLGGILYVDFVNDDNFNISCDTLYKRILGIIQPLKLQTLVANSIRHPELVKNITQNTTLIQPFPCEVPSVPLIGISIEQVGNLLDSLKFSNYKKVFIDNEVDGTTLSSCEGFEDVVSLGVSIAPKAKSLYLSIEKYKKAGVPVRLLESPEETSNTISPQPLVDIRDAFQTHCKSNVHKGDWNRDFEEVWKYFQASDWDRKGKGQWCDAIKSISIGTARLSEDEDASCPELLLIKYYDTERKPNRSNYDPLIAVWGVSFTTSELKPLLNTIEASAASTTLQPSDLLIHREPYAEPDDDTSSFPWLQETSWLLESTGHVTGITVAIRCSQDDGTSKVADLRFKMRGESFELVDVTRRATSLGADPCVLLGNITLELPPDQVPPPSSLIDAATTATTTGSEASPSHWKSYEEAVSSGASGDGFGPDFQCDLWLSILSPLSNLPCRVIVTTAIVNPDRIYIRMTDDNTEISGSYSSPDLSFFHRIAYRGAKDSSVDVVAIDGLIGGSGICHLSGLLYRPLKIFYGFKAEIIIKDKQDDIIAHAVKYCRINYSKFVKSSDDW